MSGGTATRPGGATSGVKVGDGTALRAANAVNARVASGPSGILLQIDVAERAEVVIDGQQGNLADVQTGMQVSLQMAQDRPTITRIDAISPGKVLVKGIDVDKRTITVSVGGQEWTASLAADAKVVVAGNQEAQLTDLSVGMLVSVRLGVDADRIVVRSVMASGE